MEWTPVLCFLAILGHSSALHSRIVGGRPAAIRDFPYQAAILQSNDLVCGGSLIDCNWILTAAHCVDGLPQPNITVRVGSGSFRRGGQVRTPWRIWVHPDYNADTKVFDIALIDVQTCFTLGSTVQIVPLAGSSPTPGSTAIVSGWGLTSFPDGQRASILQSLTTRTLPLEECAASLPGSTFPVTSTNICTAGPAGTGTCHGDGGDPLVSQGAQVGVVSWGVPCATGTPDVYTDVVPHIDWIILTMALRR